MANQTKHTQVDVLIDLVKSNSNFALVRFDKTLHTSLEALRKELRTNDSRLTVIKNTLFAKAIKKLATTDKKYQGLKDRVQDVKENSALLMLGEEWNKGLTTFQKFTDKEKTLSFKVGFLDETVYMTNDLVKIAKLPSKGELIAKVIGSMKTPVSSFNFALKYNMQKFVYILSEKSKQTSS